MLIVEEVEQDGAQLAQAARLADEPEVRLVVDVAAALRALAERPETGLLLCGPRHAAQLARAAPEALLVVTARPEEEEEVARALAGPAFDVIPLPLAPAAAAHAASVVREARRMKQEEAELAAAAGELGARRAQQDGDIAELAARRAGLPRLERLRAELSATLIADLCSRMAEVPAQLEGAIVAIDDAGTRSAVVDGAFAARAAVRMVSDLLDAIRAEHCPLPAEPRAVPVDAFVDQLLAAVARVASDYSTRILVERSIRSPECRTDAALLSRALENLIECGVRRSRKGQVRFSVDAGEGQVRFEVADSGGEVAAPLLGNLFSRLARLDGATIQRGAALGFCRAAAEALGGSVQASSEAGGLRLSLTIPQAA